MRDPIEEFDQMLENLDVDEDIQGEDPPHFKEFVFGGFKMWCNDSFKDTSMGKKYLNKCRKNIRDYIEHNYVLSSDPIGNQAKSVSCIFPALYENEDDVRYLSSNFFYDMLFQMNLMANKDKVASLPHIPKRSPLAECIRKRWSGSYETQIFKRVASNFFNILDSSKKGVFELKPEYLCDEKGFDLFGGEKLGMNMEEFLYTIFKWELDESYMRFLRKKCCETLDIYENNCIRMAAIEDDVDIIIALADAYEGVLLDIERIFPADDEAVAFREQHLMDEVRELVDKVEDLKIRFDAEAEEKDRYKRLYEESINPSSDNSTKELAKKQKIINSQEWRISKLLEELDEKESRIQELEGGEDFLEDSEVEEETFTFEENTENTRKFDAEGRYVFFSTDKGFQLDFERLLKGFPNSISVSDPERINAKATDAVIILTRHISHDAYYRVKNVCRAKNIPYTHVKYNNPERIKNVLECWASGRSET